MGLNILPFVWPLCVLALLKDEALPLDSELPFLFEDSELEELQSQSSMKRISPGVFKDAKDPSLQLIKIAPGVFKPYKLDAASEKKIAAEKKMAPPALLQTSSEDVDAASAESETGFGRLRSLVSRAVGSIKQSHAEKQKLTAAARAERDKASLKTVAEFGQRSLDKFGEVSRDLGKQNRVQQAFNQVQRRQRKKANLQNARGKVARAALQKLQVRKAEKAYSRNMLAYYAGFLNSKRPWINHEGRHQYLKNMVNGMHQEMKRAKTQHGARSTEEAAEVSSSDDFQEKAEADVDIEQEVEPADGGEGVAVDVDENDDGQDEPSFDSPQSEGNAEQTL